MLLRHRLPDISSPNIFQQVFILISQPHEDRDLLSIPHCKGYSYIHKDVSATAVVEAFVGHLEIVPTRLLRQLGAMSLF